MAFVNGGRIVSYCRAEPWIMNRTLLTNTS